MKSSYLTIICFVLVALLCNHSFAQEGDVAAEFTKALPKGWSCEILSEAGTLYCNVTTTEMETDGSRHGNASPFPETKQLTFRFKILPKYTSAMIDQIKKHNAPLEKQLESLDYYSPEYRDVSRQLIDMPQFMDSNYGYLVEYSSRVPKNDADKKRLVGFLEAVSTDWESVESDNQPVDELARRLTW